MTSPPKFKAPYPNAKVREAAQAVGGTLHDIKYAVVGGAACAMLGSRRLTADVDIVVPKGDTKAARSRLRQNPECFEVDKRTLHTEYKSSPANIMIEILTPPVLFKSEFTQDTPVYEIDGVKVLKPTLLLETKCAAIVSRAGEDGKRKDASDIIFLLKWCVQHSMLPTAEEVPSATGDFIRVFVETFGGQDLWEQAGFKVMS